MTAASNWGGVLPQYSLSEVRFFYIPVVAREPSPDSGATGVDPDAILSWRAGREAAKHSVYLSDDFDGVTNGGAPVATVTNASYSSALDLASRYFWRIDEVNDLETPTTWEGDVWDFTTQEYLVVEDFEDYNDYPSYEIYSTWLDGYENPANGSQVGYLTPPIAETTIVHGGKQSMPLIYSNSGGAAYSEATRTFAVPRDWTKYGIKTLSLWFSGAAGNTGQLFVKINGVKIPYDGEAANLAATTWQPWNIDLTALGVSLASVTTLTIGIEGNGAAGTLYFDDIRLYAYPRQVVTPVQPDPAALVAHFEFEGSANDSVGGHNGTPNGGPTYSTGHSGQAISLDGTDDYIVVGSVGISGAAPRTIGGWAKASSLTFPEWVDVFGFTGPSGDNGHFDIELVGNTSTTTLGWYGIHVYGWEYNIMRVDSEWHHLAASYDGTTIKWYGDGLLVGSDRSRTLNTPDNVHVGKRQDNDNYFPGSVDDVQIFSRVLSDAEIAGLAGRTLPFDEPLSLPLVEVELEAEAADMLGANWRSYDDPNASGGKAIGSETGDGNDYDYAPGADWTATYSFTAPAGDYRILLRVQEVGNDSFWVRVPTAVVQTHEDPDQPGTGWVRFNGIDAPNGWTWDEVHSDDHGQAVVTWTLPAGEQTLEIAKREEGVLLDAILITNDLD